MSSDEQYDLIFKGELVSGFELSNVKRNLQALFKLDETKINALFSGKAIPLKKGLDPETANKYRVAMKKAGARVDLLRSEGATTAPSAPIVQPIAVSPKPVSDAGAVAKSVSDMSQPEQQSAVKIKAPDFGLAAVGADLLADDEKTIVQPLDVNIAHLQVAPQEGNLVGEDEILRPPLMDVTVPDLDLAALGSDLLKDDERRRVEPIKVSTHHLSVAEPGERLGPEASSAPPPPNVDHIRLVE